MSGSPGQSTAILHVDDDPALGEVAARYLERENDAFDVETVTSAAAALDALAEEEIDCIVSDYDMPGTNGIEFLEAVREDHPDLPFILFTGKGSEEVASEAISAGVTDYLQKDVGGQQFELLANRVANAVEAHRAGREAARLERINALIRTITQELVEAETVDAIERTVCEALTGSETYRFAWIGEPDPATGEIRPRTSAGAAQAYLDDITVRYDDEGNPKSQGPGGRAVRTKEAQLVENLDVEPAFEPWRGDATRYGFESVLALPLLVEGSVHGVLGIYADEPAAFADTERAVLEELAETIGDALRAAKTRRTLEEREQELERFKQLVDAMGEAAAIYDETGRFEIVNESLAAAYDAEPEELVGRHSRLVEQIRNGVDAEGADPFAELVAGEREALWGEIELGEDFGDAEVAEYRLTRLTTAGSFDGVVGVTRDITARHRHEQELEELTTRHRLALEETDTGVWVRNFETDEVIWDRATESLFGYEPDGFPGTVDGFVSLVHPDDLDYVEAEIERAIAADEMYEADFRICPPDGRERWVQSRGIVERDGGDPSRMVGVVTDITDRKERERELEAAERRFEAVFNNPISFMGLLEPDGTVVEVNDAARAFVDADPGAHTGKAFWETPWWNHDPALQADLQGWVDRAAEGESVRYEADHRGPDGGRLTMDGVLHPIRDDDGAVVSLLAAGRDISERKARERELSRTNTILATLLENMPIGVLAEDADRRILAANDALGDVIGIPGNTDELVGRDCAGLAREVSDQFADPEAFVARIEELLDRREMVLEETLELADGRTLSRSFVPLSLPDGEGTLWLYRDVTDRIRREADLQRQNERLDEFANLVSHDLRNPLDVAEGKLELAREECGSDHLESVAQSHARMRVLIEDLLRYAQEGTDVTDREAVDLAALVESSWEVVDTAGATLDVETTATVRADRTRCKQLLENVLRNAVDHGGEDVTITVGDCEEGAGFFVADDGPGIPPGKREAVLESGVSTSADGTGFGLAIVRQIAEGHGWDVAVTESAAGGARLEFTGVDRPD